MACPLTQLAIDATNDLAAHSFSREINVTRALAPYFKTEELTGVEVVVRPAEKTGEDYTRSTQKKGLTIQVAVVSRLDSSGNTDTDPMLDLMDEIETFFVGDGDTVQPWRSSDGLVVSSYQVIPFDEEVLFSRNQFTGMLSLTFDQYT